MSLYTIADLHLSKSTDKPMDVFGEFWERHEERLLEGFSRLTDEDVTVIPGDVSWGMSLSESLLDFKFIDSLPGKKIISKGNHDYWWETVSKMKRFFAENAIETIDFLHNSCYFYNGAALCGTRGWLYDKNDPAAGDDKIFKRELLRLEASLKAAVDQGAQEIDCFLHYPPVFAGTEVPQITEILPRYPVKRVFYGHLHGDSLRGAFSGMRNGIYYAVVSADALGFKPIQIRE